MASSPLRHNFINIEATPAKALVTYDINSWLETNLKQSLKKLPKHKSQPRRSSQLITKPCSSAQISSLASLKNRRMILLGSSVRKEPLQGKTQVVRASTEIAKEGRSNKTKSTQPQSNIIKQFKIKLHQIEVSEFKAETNSTHNLIYYRPKKEANILTKRVKGSNRNLINKNSQKQNVCPPQAKMLQHKMLLRRPKRSSNLLWANPEANNLVFKTRRLLSVKQSGESS